jgi:hypothetical protein
MIVWGDMMVFTGYPVMVVIMVVITKIEMVATALPQGNDECMARCFCI